MLPEPPSFAMVPLAEDFRDRNLSWHLANTTCRTCCPALRQEDGKLRPKLNSQDDERQAPQPIQRPTVGNLRSHRSTHCGLLAKRWRGPPAIRFNGRDCLFLPLSIRCKAGTQRVDGLRRYVHLAA